jgi:hypothetical protein
MYCYPSVGYLTNEYDHQMTWHFISWEHFHFLQIAPSWGEWWMHGFMPNDPFEVGRLERSGVYGNKHGHIPRACLSVNKQLRDALMAKMNPRGQEHWDAVSPGESECGMWSISRLAPRRQRYMERSWDCYFQHCESLGMVDPVASQALRDHRAKKEAERRSRQALNDWYDAMQ